MEGREIPTIGVKDIEKYQNRKDVCVIDVRDREEYEIFHIDGAKNLPYEEMAEWEKYLSVDILYILYCERGSMSMMAAKELSAKGYKIFTLVGGIRAFQNKKLD